MEYVLERMSYSAIRQRNLNEKWKVSIQDTQGQLLVGVLKIYKILIVYAE